MIPIYRAKRIDSDEWVEGYFTDDKHIKGKYFITEIDSNYYNRIDHSTLAIHFPNSMIDKNGKKIFASLREDGVGGDCCLNTIVMSMLKDKEKLTEKSMKHPLVFTTNGIYSGGICPINKISNFSDHRVIGIYQ